MRIVYCVSLIILSVMILLLGARMQQLILLAGTVIYFLFRTYKKMGLLRSVAGAVLIGAFIIGLTLLSSSNRERFKEAFNYDIENRYGERQGRFLIWSCAMELIKSAPVIGTGIGDVQDDLQKCYLQHEYISLTYLKDTRFNAHNQFLETAIELGVPGLLMLIISLFLSLRFALKHKKILYLVFIMLFIISCMTESLLERQNGIVFYAFFNSLLFLYGSDKEAEYAREKVPAGR
jgi:O-antigen ligase